MSAVGLAARPRTTQLARVAGYAFSALFLLSGLQAYAAGPVPMDWIAQFGFIGLAAGLYAGGRPIAIPSLLPFLWFALFAAASTLANAALFDYSSLMPEIATTSYPLFLALRFLAIAGFVAAAYVTVWCAQSLGFEAVRRPIVLWGAALSAFALYVYIASSLGLPEPPRTRLGTGGVEQSTVFSYAFHRALGSFREPSHLAAWLTIPFLLSLRGKGICPSLYTLIIGAALLLSGSMTGYVAVAGGFLAACLLFGSREGIALRMGAKAGAATVIGLVAFTAATQLAPGNGDLWKVVVDRLGPIFMEGGFDSTNRGFIYSYVETLEITPFGVGLGHTGLLMSRDLGLALYGSFSNLFLVTLYGLGWVGLGLLLYALLRPLAASVFVRTGDASLKWAAAAGYVAWLFISFALNEELGIQFGIALGLLAAATRTEAKT